MRCFPSLSALFLACASFIPTAQAQRPRTVGIPIHKIPDAQALYIQGDQTKWESLGSYFKANNDDLETSYWRSRYRLNHLENRFKLHHEYTNEVTLSHCLPLREALKFALGESPDTLSPQQKIHVKLVKALCDSPTMNKFIHDLIPHDVTLIVDDHTYGIGYYEARDNLVGYELKDDSETHIHVPSSLYNKNPNDDQDFSFLLMTLAEEIYHAHQNNVQKILLPQFLQAENDYAFNTVCQYDTKIWQLCLEAQAKVVVTMAMLELSHSDEKYHYLESVNFSNDLNDVFWHLKPFYKNQDEQTPAKRKTILLKAFLSFFENKNILDAYEPVAEFHISNITSCQRLPFEDYKRFGQFYGIEGNIFDPSDDTPVFEKSEDFKQLMPQACLTQWFDLCQQFLLNNQREPTLDQYRQTQRFLSMIYQRFNIFEQFWRENTPLKNRKPRKRMMFVHHPPPLPTPD